MKAPLFRIAWGTTLLLLVAGCGTPRLGTGETGTSFNRAGVNTLIADWPEDARTAARAMMEKYGAPRGVTRDMLVWHDTGPFARTIVYRQSVPHNFPMAHTDLLEQVVSYRVPPEMFSELARYDGSVIVERTKGEMSARCDKEEMNILALNLAHEIVSGRMNAARARETYAEQAQLFMTGQPAPFTERLMFTPVANAADPDVPTPAPVRN